MNVKFRKCFLQIITVAIILCIISCTHVTKVISTNQSLWLSKDQVITLKEQVKQGNYEAANRLYLYYSCVELDNTSASKWVSLSATNGNAWAQYTLGMLYSDGVNPFSIDTKAAKYWFQQASRNGDTNALSRLKDLDNLK